MKALWCWLVKWCLLWCLLFGCGAVLPDAQI